MKKLLLVALLIFPFLLNAQSKFHFGITAGGGLTGWHDEHNINYLEMRQKYEHQFVFGFVAGGFVQYKFWKRFSLHSEFLYANSGSKFTYTWNDGFHQPSGKIFKRIEKLEYNIHSLQIPVSLSFDITKTKVVPYIKVGVVPNYIVDGKRDYYFSLSTTGESYHKTGDLYFTGENEDLQFEIRPLFGIGVSIFERFSFEATLSSGESFVYYLHPIVNNNPLDNADYAIPSEKSYVNRSIMFMVKYNLN